MHRNFLFDLDQTLLDFHASEYSIDYCASSFDELYSVLKKWSTVSEKRP